MREARMTFGEHLEELRRRIIFALIYLGVGLGITLAYGTQLMEWTLQPHYRAFGAAQRNRLIARMEQTVARLDRLTSVAPEALVGAAAPAIEGGLHWEVLFLRDVAIPEIHRRLEAPFREFAGALRGELAALPEATREGVFEAAERLGKDVSRVFVSEFAPELETEAFARIPDRFRALSERLAGAADEIVRGFTWLQTRLGWGKDLEGVIGPLRRFSNFLDLRREEALQSQLTLDALRERQKAAKLPGILGEILESLEADAKGVVEGTPPRIWVISYIESFSAYLKVALILGTIIALPGILYELWKFIGAGLYPHEQKYVVTILPFSVLLFVVGGGFGYFVMIPVGLEFLASWGVEDVELSFTLGSYIGLFFTLTLILGLVFQTPLVMIFLAKIGVVDVNGFRKARRVAIFVGVILAVILTPPDPFSWSLMAVPMILLYEVGILACRILTRR